MVGIEVIIADSKCGQSECSYAARFILRGDTMTRGFLVIKEPTNGKCHGQSAERWPMLDPKISSIRSLRIAATLLVGGGVGRRDFKVDPKMSRSRKGKINRSAASKA